MLHIRPFRKGDAKRIIDWAKDEETFYKWSAGILGDYPITEDKLLEATSGRDDNDKYYPFVAFDERGPVGFFTIRVLGDNDEIARFGFVIVDPSIRGKGYGKKMLSLGLKYAFEIQGFKKASLGVFDNNEAAYNCYKSVGFVPNGITEAYELNGTTWNCIEMENNTLLCL